MTPLSSLRAMLAAAGLALAAGSACAQSGEAADIAQLRAATAKLIGMLVEQGLLTQDKAAALLKDVGAIGSGSAAAAAPAAKPASGAAGAPVRVPYVPEFVRKEIKEEVRSELVAQAQREGWAGPGAVPDWVRRLQFDGDLRFRAEHDKFDPANAPAISVNDTNRNRAVTLLNTTENRNRLRVRARLGLSAEVDENWSAGVRLTTGSTTNPLSSNQTLGVYNNRFVAAFDRAYIRYRRGEQFNAVLGRFGNPWFGSELLWSPDLSFDGVALQWLPKLGDAKGFATLAALPVQDVDAASGNKWLFGAQLGAELPATPSGLGAKVGLGYFRYSNIVGRANAPGSSLLDYTAPQFAQKGNTYFNISSDPTRPLLALASDYKLVNLTGSIDVPSFGGKRVILLGDFVKNLGFDRQAVAARVGADVEPKTRGWLVRAAFGSAALAESGDWQAYTGYRRVERDAVLDAFNDSDFHLGGTDTKGWILGLNYGLGRNTVGSVRYLSADAINGPSLAIDVLQFDLSMRF